ncbi:unnamed protein product [Brassica rapa subsp. trilocularis]
MSGEACDFIDWNREPLRVAGVLLLFGGLEVSFGGGLLRRRVEVGYAGEVDASFSCHHFKYLKLFHISRLALHGYIWL